ncbi:hypothetical protein EYZ11_010613 [Aspergillus tanneri]|uniref:Uncharacterized protein n=1 Tax=Aspergillus tanneri TaxID=1220188 RepID=A0A4S3JAA5_9EURO|nr:hypothetical protein EYZ11_010613 [Aspergillus tanneri]
MCPEPNGLLPLAFVITGANTYLPSGAPIAMVQERISPSQSLRYPPPEATTRPGAVASTTGASKIVPRKSTRGPGVEDIPVGFVE